MLSQATEDRRRGMHWTLSTVLEDDIALPSHSINDRREKSDRFNRFAWQVGLKISPNKTEVLPVNFSAPLTIYDSYTYNYLSIHVFG